MDNNHKHTYQTRSKKNTPQMKSISNVDSDTDSQDESENETETETESESENKFDIHEYKKLLAKIFPSKYTHERAKQSDSNKRGCKSPTLSDDASVCSKKRKTKSKDDEHQRPANLTILISQAGNDSDGSDTSDNVLLNKIADILQDETSPKKCNKTKLLNKKKTANSKKFSLLLEEKKMTNDIKYFEEHMSLEDQEKAIKELEEIINHCNVDKPYRLQLLASDIPTIYKAAAYKKINSLQHIEAGTGEFYKIKRWVDTFMQIPFGKYKNLPVTLKDNGLEECATFMDKAKKHLDSAVYGMTDAKIQIMQLIGQWITNPTAMGTAIAIKGPMGTGKTTLVKEGISKAIGRDFSFMALGGATDSCFLEGHSYTYEGSTWGKIIDNIVQCKSMNPIFFFDELDKVSDTPKGEEIIGILTHLIDTSQNSKFHDKYFSELEFDLSRCLFIFSYNDESKVNPILRDRMYCVETKGYDVKEKIVIANEYLLPKIREQVCFNEGDILIPDETMKYIITQRTENEEGIRNLKRCLEIIHTKINLYRLLRTGATLFEKESIIEVKFPLTITNEIVDKLVNEQKKTGNWSNMYI